MKKVLILLRAHLRVFAADRVAVLLTFVIPIVMIGLFGAIFGGSGRAQSSGIPLAFLNRSDAPVSRSLEGILDTLKTFRLIRTMKDENGNQVVFDTSSIQDFVKRGNAPAALVIPADAYTDTSVGFKICFYYDPRNEIEMQIVQGMLQKTIMEQIPQVFMESMKRQAKRSLGPARSTAFNADIKRTVTQYFPGSTFDLGAALDDAAPDGAAPDGAGAAKAGGANTRDTTDRASADSGAFAKRAGSMFSKMVDFRSTQLVGREIANPNATRSVGGWAMMFLLFTLSGVANALIDERRNAVFMRMLVAPFSRAHILASRYVFGTVLGTIQLIVMFMMGMLLFNVDILSNAGNLLLVILLSAAAATGFGMLIAAFSRTMAQASALGMLLILAMSAVGGAWFPTSIMPPYIQVLSKFSLVYWSISGFLSVLWAGATFVEILPILGVLAGIAALVIGVSLWKFSRTNVL